MLSWLIAGITLLWGIYQHYNPRILCKLHYTISNVSKDHHLRNGLSVINSDGNIDSWEDYSDLVGKVFEIRSMGNICAKDILVHVRLKYPVSHWEIFTDESYGKPYGQTNEFNLKMNNLNPTDVLRICVFCDKEKVQPREDILVEHRVSLNEGKAKRVKNW